MRSLNVYIDQRRVGTLREGDDLWSFEYDGEWVLAGDGFDLSPALPRAQVRHEDGGTQRPVQWYFDNLLPEELLRESIEREAGIRGDDAFALLEFLGAESAGSLTLLPADKQPTVGGSLQPLAHQVLSDRIANMPRQTLASGAPKRMSLAGAQHKLTVILQGNDIFEPVGATPSTHILKPNHPDPDRYPASVFNEWVTMRLARRMGMDTPDVHMLYVPQPIYVVDRFDRQTAQDGQVRRVHIIDACQLLNKARTFKHAGATLDTLAELVAATRNRAHTRRGLFTWLLFNVLVGNDDCHLKNLSFYVDSEGIRLAPHYDLLSTGAYYTRAIAGEHGSWPTVPMAFPLRQARHFGQVNRAAILEAGQQLGVPGAMCERILDGMTRTLMGAFADVMAEYERMRPQAPQDGAINDRIARVLRNITYAEMLARVRT